MNKEETEFIGKIALENATYNINAIGYPSKIVLRKDIDNMINIIERLDKENTNLKQALNEIKEYIESQKEEYISENYYASDYFCDSYSILQIIDKVLGDEK